MVDPQELCRKHLLGEHNELHKHLPSLRKGYNIKGRFFPIVQIELSNYTTRHDILVKEMLKRGYNHKSPLIDVPNFRKIYPKWFELKADIEYNLIDLSIRCKSCRSFIHKKNTEERNETRS